MSNRSELLGYKDETRGNYDLDNDKRTIQDKHYSN